MNTYLKILITLCCFFFFTLEPAAQKDSTKLGVKVLNNLDSLRDWKMRIGGVKITPYIAPAYAPETQAMLSAGGLITFKIQEHNPFLERSSIAISGGYSTNKSLLVSIKSTIYGRKDLNRAIGEWWLRDMPDHYWGVGYENGRLVEQGDSTTLYHRHWWRFWEKVIRQLKPNVFVGAVVDINRTKASSLNPRMREDPEILEHGTNIRNSGLGVVFQYDSRDMRMNAYKGMLLGVEMTFYGNFFGGNHVFQVMELDYRQYKKIKRERSTLAWQIKNRTTFGDVPWPELSFLGTPFDLRGYFWGRYRDRVSVFGLVEYRQMFRRKKPNKKGSYDSRAGFAVWTGAGSIGSGFDDLVYWLPSVGVGFRLEVQPRMNVRLDFGVGVESTGIYLSFSEAF